MRFKHKARDRGIAVALARERNAVIGAHRRSRYIFVTLLGEAARARGLRCAAYQWNNHWLRGAPCHERGQSR